MSNDLIHPGTFGAKIIDFDIQHGSDGSKSLGIQCQFETIESRGEGQVEPYPGYRVSGTVWIIGRDGDIKEKNMESFIAATGWDGDWTKIAKTTPWEPALVEIDCRKEQYEGNEYVRAAFVNPWSGRGPIGKVYRGDEAKQVAQRLNAQLGEIAKRFYGKVQPDALMREENLPEAPPASAEPETLSAATVPGGPPPGHPVATPGPPVSADDII